MVFETNRCLGVIVLLFFVLGPFGLPLLHKSPKFSEASKAMLTIVIILYTSYLIVASLEIARELYKRTTELQDMFRMY